MSIYDKASLVLIPSGTKTSKVYSQVPTNGDGDFTFSRSTAATRVNASGNIEKETQNLLLQSNSFDTTWNTSSPATITGGQTDKDGGTNAWKLEAVTASTAYTRQFINTSSSVATFSFYAKAGTANWTYVNCINVTAFFDLANGTTGYVSGSSIDTSITSVGGGWYRISLTGTGMTQQRIYTAPANNNSVSAVGDNIYIQDAQLEYGLVARDYIETTTTAIYGGITDNVPRLDYTDSSCPALLLEPQRSNNISQSEYHQGAIAAVTRTYNTTDTLSPEGYYNAVKYEVNANNSDPYLRVFNIPTSGNDATFSLYVKGASGQLFSMILGRDGYNELAYEAFTLDGTWQRLTLSKTFTTTPTTLTIGAEFSHSSDDGVLGQEYYLYGLQCEAGSYATSYIPTYGSAVTRERDNCDLNDVSNIRGDRKGTIYVEGKISTLDTAGIMPLTYGGGTANLIYLWIRTNGQLIADIYTDNVYVSSLNTGGGYFNVGDSFKIAVAYQDNDAVLYVNGTLIESDDNLIAPNPNLLRIGKYNAAGYTGGSYTNAMVFPTRLSNEELATLTTI